MELDGSAETDLVLSTARALHEAIRARVVASSEAQSTAALATVVEDGPGDTMFAIDRVGEEKLVEELEPVAAQLGGVVLVAEGVTGGVLTLPAGYDEARARWRWLCDPIDGTRGLMYQKRSAWVLSGIAPNRGAGTRLSDIIVSVQTEIPTVKQHLFDELWAVRGRGARALRHNRLDGTARPLELCPSRADHLRQGFAMLSRMFPGGRAELASLDDSLMLRVMGLPPADKALCFEDQYLSTGGQLYELITGRDRFNADLRPLLEPVLLARGMHKLMCCHPYDICTLLIAEEAGVLVTDAWDRPLDAPLVLDHDVAWVGYANPSLRGLLAPPLQELLRERGLLPGPDVHSSV